MNWALCLVLKTAHIYWTPLRRQTENKITRAEQRAILFAPMNRTINRICVCAMGLREEMSRSAVAMGFIVKFADNNDVYSSKDVHELEGKRGNAVCQTNKTNLWPSRGAREEKKTSANTNIPSLNRMNGSRMKCCEIVKRANEIKKKKKETQWSRRARFVLFYAMWVNKLNSEKGNQQKF